MHAANSDTAVDQCPAGSGADVIELGASSYEITIAGKGETLTLGSFTRSASAGASNIPFSGRLGGRKLRPGSYTLTASPTDPSGNRGTSRSAKFEIVNR